MRFLGWLLMVIGLTTSLIACETSSVRHVSNAELPRIIPFVDAAMTQPMANLYARAQAGAADDQAIYGLAVIAGRDTSGLGEFEDREAYRVRLESDEMGFYTAWMPISETPTEDEVDRWSVLAMRQMPFCVPCKPYGAGHREPDADYATYLRINNGDEWLRDAMRQQPSNDAYRLAMPCVTAVREAVAMEAAVAWLDADMATATGRRAVLNRALREKVYDNQLGWEESFCPVTESARWRKALKERRPELPGQVARYLEPRLSDPRLPKA